MKCSGCDAPVPAKKGHYRAGRMWCKTCWPKWLAYLHDSNAGAPPDFPEERLLSRADADIALKIAEGLALLEAAEDGECVEEEEVVVVEEEEEAR